MIWPRQAADSECAAITQLQDYIAQLLMAANVA